MSIAHQGIQFAAHKMPLPSSPEERRLHRENMLFRVLNMKNVVAVVGSGCTTPLGYDSWTRFAQKLLATTRTTIQRSDEQQRLEDLTVGPGSSENDLTYSIGVCQSLIGRPEEKDYYAKYAEFFRTNFGDKGEPVVVAEGNPLIDLVKLPLYRFMTTNYDREIERAVQHVYKTRPTSFTQTEKNQTLTRFSLSRARAGEDRMVFHCHGRHDEIGSIIASEADYQDWYVSDKYGSAFRQTIELLLESNPLLFVGYGLRDEDLLRPLRQLGALDPRRKMSRPIFALIASEDFKADNSRLELYYERYGLHAIPYPIPKGTKKLTQSEPEKAAQQFGDSLCEKLRSLADAYLSACDNWHRKPNLRAPEVPSEESRPKALMLPPFDRNTPKHLDEIQGKDLVEKIREEIRQKKHLLCVVGPGGSSKTTNIYRLIEAEEKDPKSDFAGFYFWNANYTNEAFTGLDHAIRYVAVPEGDGTRQERMLSKLAKQKYLMVVDGCERLLRPLARPGEGRAYGAGFRQILRILARLVSNEQFESVVVFSGRLWPSELIAEGLTLGKDLVKLEAERALLANVEEAFASIKGMPEGQTSALCSLLDGHCYGLLLAKLYLETGKDPRELERRLAEQPPRKRLDTMIELAMSILAADLRDLLQRMALFTEPVGWDTILECWKDAYQGPPTGLRERLKEIEHFFLIPIEGGRYVVHATLRGFLRRSESLTRSFVPADFALPGYTSRTNGIDPGSDKAVDRSRKLFQAFCGTDPGQPRSEQICRGAYSILRSQWECTTAVRRLTYDEYAQIGIRLANLIKVSTPGAWSFCEPGGISGIEGVGLPLHVAELAWLYNDVGFALFGEGLLSDAFAVWDQAYEISKMLEATPPYGEYVVESLLNLAHTLIELGYVADAIRYLDDAAQLNVRLEDPEVGHRILCFRAFCDHIQGNLRSADDLYETAIGPLVAGENRRAASYFRTLQAEAALELGDVDRAARLARESRALAEIGDYPDLVGYARLAETDVLVKRGELMEARRGFDGVLQDARKMGIRALEAFARLKLADLSLLQGDTESARRGALQTLKTSNELGLALMTTRALISLAQATIRSGERELGLGYLEIAEQQARRQQYGLRLRDAERYRREFGT
jgi:tetratricopeptide (TPR) repeat protein